MIRYPHSAKLHMILFRAAGPRPSHPFCTLSANRLNERGFQGQDPSVLLFYFIFFLGRRTGIILGLSCCLMIVLIILLYK